MTLGTAHTSAKAADIAKLLLLSSYTSTSRPQPVETLTHSLANKMVVQLRPKSVTGSSFFTGVYPVLL